MYVNVSILLNIYVKISSTLNSLCLFTGLACTLFHGHVADWRLIFMTYSGFVYVKAFDIAIAAIFI